MKRYIISAISAISLSVVCSQVQAQVGRPFIHDPSTIAECDGKYYTFGTGGGGLISEDGWAWYGGAERPGRGAAPDVIKIEIVILLHTVQQVVVWVEVTMVVY